MQSDGPAGGAQSRGANPRSQSLRIGAQVLQIPLRRGVSLLLRASPWTDNEPIQPDVRDPMAPIHPQQLFFTHRDPWETHYLSRPSAGTLEELVCRQSTVILLSGTGGRRLFAFPGHFISFVFGKTYLMHWQAGTLLTVSPR